MKRRALAFASVLVPLVVAASSMNAGGPESQATATLVPWPYVAADAQASRYSPLTDINRDNVARLQLAWEWEPKERPKPNGAMPDNFSGTPIMIDNVVYISTMYTRVVALDAETGAELWAYDPEAYRWGQNAQATGFTHRGLTPWWDGDKLYLFLASRHR